jgi:hypothetical protein
MTKEIKQLPSVQMWAGSEEHWVRPGVIDSDAVFLFRHGLCVMLAVVIAEETGWPASFVRPTTPLPNFVRIGKTTVTRGTRRWMHAMVKVPNGNVLDIVGQQSMRQACDYWNANQPKYGPYWWEQVDQEKLFAETGFNSSKNWDEHESTVVRSFAKVLINQVS